MVAHAAPLPVFFVACLLVLQVGALVYIGLMWSKREQLGLSEPASFPGVKEMKRFVGNGGAMLFRQVNANVMRRLQVCVDHVHCILYSFIWAMG